MHLYKGSVQWLCRYSALVTIAVQQTVRPPLLLAQPKTARGCTCATFEFCHIGQAETDLYKITSCRCQKINGGKCHCHYNLTGMSTSTIYSFGIQLAFYPAGVNTRLFAASTVRLSPAARGGEIGSTQSALFRPEARDGQPIEESSLDRQQTKSRRCRADCLRCISFSSSVGLPERI